MINCSAAMVGTLSLYASLFRLLFLCSLSALVRSQTLSTLSSVEAWSTTENAGNLTDSSTMSAADHDGISLFHWNYDYVADPLKIALFVLLAGIVKLVFHHVPHLSSFVPESCVLIIIGTIVGAILKYGIGVPDEFRLDSRTFMLFLLPPIILEASYNLNDRMFSDNFGTILIYAILGTVINFIIIGFAMYGLDGVAMDVQEFDLTLLHFLIFASFIVAVDPVAVLAIFQDVKVNKRLYFLVFGESLLNDAVTIVLNNMMKAFKDSSHITPEEVVLGILSFFTTTLGSLGIGILMGIISALATRLTARVRVMESLAILTLAYLSYLCAEMCHWSGIISIIGCGLMQAQYALHNISRKSNITIHYFIKMLSSVTDSIIFMFLGLELVRTNYVWNTGFILWALLLCLVARLVSVFGLTFFVNLAPSSHPIKLEEQFIMWYGGLRGAICFALCSTVEVEEKLKNLFLTTTFVVIIFTVFGQGITIKPLVKICKIIKDTDVEKELLIELHNLLTGNLTTGIDAILGETGSSSIMTKIYDFNEKYLRRYLQKNPLNEVDQFLNVYRQISMKYYMASINNPTTAIISEKEPAKDNFMSVNIGERSNIEAELNREIMTNLYDGTINTLSDFQFPLNEGEIRQKLSDATVGSFTYSDSNYQLERGKVSMWNEASAADATVEAGRRFGVPRIMSYKKNSGLEPAHMSKKDITKLHKVLSKASLASNAAFPHDRDLIYHDLEEFPAFDQQMIKQDLAKSMLNLNVGSRHVSFDATGRPIVFKASSRRTSPFYSTQVIENWLPKRRSELESPSAFGQNQELVESSYPAPLPTMTVTLHGQSLPINAATSSNGQALPFYTTTSPGQELPDDATTPAEQASSVVSSVGQSSADGATAPRFQTENPGSLPESVSSGGFPWQRLASRSTMASLSTLAEEQPEDRDWESNKGSQASLITGQSLKVVTGTPEVHTNVLTYLEMERSEVTPNMFNKGFNDETHF